jgi:hypothetical protein
MARYAENARESVVNEVLRDSYFFKSKVRTLEMIAMTTDLFIFRSNPYLL